MLHSLYQCRWQAVDACPCPNVQSAILIIAKQLPTHFSKIYVMWHCVVLWIIFGWPLSCKLEDWHFVMVVICLSVVSVTHVLWLNGARYGLGYHRSLIGSHILAFELPANHIDLGWPWRPKILLKNSLKPLLGRFKVIQGHRCW